MLRLPGKKNSALNAKSLTFGIFLVMFPIYETWYLDFEIMNLMYILDTKCALGLVNSPYMISLNQSDTKKLAKILMQFVTHYGLLQCQSAVRS